MSFENNAISSRIAQNHQHPELHLQQQTHNQNQQHQQISAMSTSVSLPLIQNSNNNMTMFNGNSSPPQQISPTAAEVNFNSELMIENVMPGIYLTKNFICWKKEQLKAHGFTHVIIIDKHIQELYYPNQQPEIFKLCRSDYATNRNGTGATADGIYDDSSSLNTFTGYDSSPTASTLNFGKEFEVIDLNFGEKSYLTTVLPNCYRAVKFINKALQSGGSILVIDCNGGEQKCLTIIVAYLMYKHNISFR